MTCHQQLSKPISTRWRISIKHEYHHRISHKNRWQWHQQRNPLWTDLKPIKKPTKKAKMGVEVTINSGGW